MLAIPNRLGYMIESGLDIGLNPVFPARQGVEMSEEATQAGTVALKEFIKLAARVEERVAVIYELFATHFKTDPELSYFWRLSAEAERYHAASIRLHNLTVDTEKPTDMSNLPVAMGELAEFIDELDSISARYRDSTPTVSEALQTAIHIESDGCEVHGRTQFSFLYPKLADLFQQLEEEDRAHRQTFLTALNRFNGD